VLFSSKVRIKLLTLFIANPGARLYLREIQRRLAEAITPLRRELLKLESIGFLRKEKIGNMTYFFVNQRFPIFEELKGIIFKTVGMGDFLKKNLRGLKNIKAAFVFGSAAKGEERLDSDIDLMIIGKVDMREVGKIIRISEEKLGREINYTIFGEEEWERKKKERNSFVLEVIRGKKIFLVGDSSCV
jgi:predicted nucleotidyltransferase